LSFCFSPFYEFVFKYYFFVADHIESTISLFSHKLEAIADATTMYTPGRPAYIREPVVAYFLFALQEETTPEGK